MGKVVADGADVLGGPDDPVGDSIVAGVGSRRRQRLGVDVDGGDVAGAEHARPPPRGCRCRCRRRAPGRQPEAAVRSRSASVGWWGATRSRSRGPGSMWTTWRPAATVTVRHAGTMTRDPTVTGWAYWRQTSRHSASSTSTMRSGSAPPARPPPRGRLGRSGNRRRGRRDRRPPSRVSMPVAPSAHSSSATTSAIATARGSRAAPRSTRHHHAQVSGRPSLRVR